MDKPGEKKTDANEPTLDDLKALGGKVDAALAEPEGAEPGGDMPSEEPGEPPPDLEPLVATGMSPEEAARVWNAAQSREDLRKLSPEKLAKKVQADMGLRMELMELARRGPGGPLSVGGEEPMTSEAPLA